jgi:uncharacterized membrane protein
MKQLTQLFLQGLLVVIPLLVTFGIFYWLFISAERVFRVPVRIVLPETWYIPGMGLLTAVLVTIAAGILVKNYIINAIFMWFEKILNRLPLVKQIYGGARDLIQFFADSRHNKLQKVVAVEFNGCRLIGFITGEKTSLGSQKNLVSVYLPLSYQIGGFLIYLPETQCEALDMSVQEAMQKALTANISNNDSKPIE